MNDRRLAQAEDEDHRAEQGELGEDEYNERRDAVTPHPDFVCLKTGGTLGSEPDPE